MRDRRYLPVVIAIILGLLVLLLSSILEDNAISVVVVIAFSLVGLFIIFFVVAQFITRLRQSIWLPLISSAVIVYTGLLIFSLSLPRFKSLIDQALPGSIPMIALGLAVVSFGWGLLMQILPRRQNILGGLDEEVSGLCTRLHSLDDEIHALSVKLQSLDKEVPTLSAKIQGVNNKLSDLEKTADVFLKQAHELGRRLVSKGGEQNDVD